MTLPFLDFVVSLPDERLTGMQRDRILPSFLRSVKNNRVVAFGEETLRLWIVDMLFADIKPTTVKRYVGALHTLYKGWTEETQCGDPDPFGHISKLIADLQAPSPWLADVDLGFVVRLAKTAPQSPEYLPANIFLYLLFNPTASLQDAIDLRFADYTPGFAQLDEVIDRMRAGRNARYVFPLGHGDRRPSAITAEVLSRVGAMLAGYGLKVGTDFSRDTITALWIKAAIACGVNAMAIRSIVEAVTSEYSFLSLLEPAPIENGEKTRIMERVSDTLYDRKLRWFVMKLRAGRTPDHVKRSISQADPRLYESLQFYYPTRQVVKRLNKKTVKADVPYLPDILFIRTYRDRVSTIVRHAGESGWCFRVTNTPSSPYTAISVAEMARFQRHIGLFTPDVEMSLVDVEPTARVGDLVKVIGGDMFDGQEGEVTAVGQADGRIVYSIRLTESLFIRWEEVRIPAALVRPL